MVNSVDLVRILFRNVLDLQTYLMQKGIVIDSQDEAFFCFSKTFIVAFDDDVPLSPPFGDKSDNYSDMIMQFVQSVLKKGTQNVITIGLEAKKEFGRGLVKSGYDVTVPLRADQTAFYAFSKPHWKQFHQLVGDAFFWFFLKNITVFKNEGTGPLIQILGKPICDVLKLKKAEEVFIAPRAKREKCRIENVCGTSGIKRKRKRSGSETQHKPKRRRLEVDTVPNYIEEPILDDQPKPTKKSVRRGRGKETAGGSDVARGEPFYHRLTLKQNVFLHAKNHREQISTSHVLTSCTVVEFFNTVNNLNVQSDESERKDNRTTRHMRKGNVWLLQSKNRPKDLKICDRTSIPIRFSAITPWLEYTVRKHGRFRKAATRIINRYCSTLRNDHLKELSTAVLLEHHTPTWRVFKFIGRAISFVFPIELFGGVKNRKAFLDVFHAILQLRKGEKFCLGLLMSRIDCKEFAWTESLCGYERKNFIAKLLLWLMRYCFMLVKSFFYVTMASNWKNRLFYYRKYLWRELHRRGVRDILEKGIFKRLDKNDAMEMIRAGLAIGYAPLRLFPKSNSMRPIAHSGWKPHVGKLTGQSLNQTLYSPFLILQNICRKNRENLGFGLLSFDEFHEKYADFVEKNANEKIFYVKADIKDCYDSINLRKLLTILHGIFEQAEQIYKLKRHVIVSELYQKISARYLSVLHKDGDPGFPDNVKNCPKSSILIDQNVYKSEIDIEEAMTTTQSHLLCHLVYAQGSYFHQVQGISQGSVLSSLLCNIYCGAFEREFVGIDGNELLVRQVDDYLFLTTKLESAKDFLRNLSRTRNDYNLAINPQKTVVNFDFADLPTERRPIRTDSSIVRWCGMMLDLGSFSIGPDYWRYEGQSLDDCVNAEYILHPGYSLHRKLLHCIRIKISKSYYDPRINSETSIVRNLFQLSYFSARVFESLYGKLTKMNRLDDRDGYRFLVEVVKSVPQKMNRQIRRICDDKNYPSIWELRFLVYSVFLKVLNGTVVDRKRFRRRLCQLKDCARKRIMSVDRMELFNFTDIDFENSPISLIIQK